MGLLMSRPEKADEMTRLVHAIRETAVAPARNGELNLTEVINCMGQALSSILAGAYHGKNRDVVMEGFPELVRAYYPQWDKLYADHAAKTATSN